MPSLARTYSRAGLVMTWYHPRGSVADYLPDRFPVFIWDTDDFYVFGIPTLDGGHPKVTPHASYGRMGGGHALVGQMTGTGNVWPLGGFSGHGFKLAPALRQVAAELAVDGKTSLPVDHLTPTRFPQLTDAVRAPPGRRTRSRSPR